MNTKEMRERLLDEIKCIPDARVAEVCDLVHFFRVGLEKAASGGGAANLMSFAGSWSDMPEEQFAALAAEWRERTELITLALIVSVRRANFQRTAPEFL